MNQNQTHTASMELMAQRQRYNQALESYFFATQKIEAAEIEKQEAQAVLTQATVVIQALEMAANEKVQAEGEIVEETEPT